MLRTVARRLSDVVGQSGLVGRIGGDEFIVLMAAFVDRPRLTVLSRQIIDAACAPAPLEGGLSPGVGIRLGIAVAPDSGKTAADILAAADAALRDANERGRLRTVFPDDLKTRDSTPDGDDAGHPAGHAASNSA